ncbi:MAG: DUF6326 family protein [Anaerolineales bacterium]
MEGIRIKLSGLWVSLMLTYLLGDVLRIFSGDFVAGEMGGLGATPGLYLAAAVVMLIPIVMLVLSLVLPYKSNRWANIILAVFLFLFNLVGLPGYISLYDQFLIVVSLVFNGLTVWFAWKWQPKEY